MICQVAVYQGRQVFAFTRPSDERTQAFATTLGATWAGGSDETPPEPLDAAIIFASAGELVPQALKVLTPGGTVVCAGIHMSDIPSFPYDDPVAASAASARSPTSPAGTARSSSRSRRRSRSEPRSPPTPSNRRKQALADLRAGRFEGSAVIVP